MLKQYCTLTNCLAELRKSDLPVIEKLRLEVQLIQTKRILLDYQVELRVTGKASSEREFDLLHDRLKSVCRCGGEPGELQLFKDHLAQIKEGLASDLPAEAPQPLPFAPLGSRVFTTALQSL